MDYNESSLLDNSTILDRPTIRPKSRRKPSIHRLTIDTTTTNEEDEDDQNDIPRNDYQEMDNNKYTTTTTTTTTNIKSSSLPIRRRSKSGASSTDSAVIPDSPEFRQQHRRSEVKTSSTSTKPLTKKEIKKITQLERENAALKQRLLESEIHIATLWRKLAIMTSKESVGKKTLQPACHGSTCPHCGCKCEIPKFARVLGLPLNEIDASKSRNKTYAVAKMRGANTKIASLLAQRVKPYYEVEKDIITLSNYRGRITHHNNGRNYVDNNGGGQQLMIS
jgi:hypothetical protein